MIDSRAVDQVRGAQKEIVYGCVPVTMMMVVVATMVARQKSDLH